MIIEDESTVESNGNKEKSSPIQSSIERSPEAPLLMLNGSIEELVGMNEKLLLECGDNCEEEWSILESEEDDSETGAIIELLEGIAVERIGNAVVLAAKRS